MIVSVTRIVSEENLILTQPSLARFEVALSAELLANGNPTRQRGLSQDQIFLAHASGYEKSAPSKLARRVSDCPLTQPKAQRKTDASAYAKNSTSQCVRDVARTDDLRRFEIKRKKASCENMRLCVSTRSICSSFTSCQTHRATRMGSLATPRLRWRLFPWSAWLASAASG